jgi:hypothetical protein
VQQLDKQRQSNRRETRRRGDDQLETMTTRTSSAWLLPAALSVTLLAACASGDRPEPPPMYAVMSRLTEQDGRACFNISDVQGSGVLGDGVVSVSTHSNRGFYLITPLDRCSWVRPMTSIGFQGGSSQVCGGASSVVGSNGYSCPISHVFTFASRKEGLAAYELAKTQRDLEGRYPTPRKASPPTDNP